MRTASILLAFAVLFPAAWLIADDEEKRPEREGPAIELQRAMERVTNAIREAEERLERELGEPTENELRKRLDGLREKRAQIEKELLGLRKKLMDEEPGAPVMDFLRKNAPDLAAELEMLRARTPEMFRRRLQELMPRLREWRELAERDPVRLAKQMEREALNAAARAVAEKIRNAQGEDKARLEAVLRPMIERLYELRLAELEAEVAQLREHLARQEAALQWGRENREGEIKKRIDELSGRGGRFDW